MGESSVTSTETVGADEAAWIVSSPDLEPSSTPGLRFESSRNIRVAFAGTLFEPEHLAARLKLSATASENPAQLVLEAYLQLSDRWLRVISGHYAIVLEDRIND